MNDIKLNKPILLNGKYVIFLDSENKFTFSNKRQAVDFLVFIQHKIDMAMLLVTEDLNVLDEIYRLYFLADRDFRFKYALHNSVDFIANRLTWISEHRGSPNHDTLLFNSLLACFDELITAFGLMRIKASSRKDTLTKRRCALRVDVLQIYMDKFIEEIRLKPSKNTELLSVMFKVS